MLLAAPDRRVRAQFAQQLREGPPFGGRKTGHHVVLALFERRHEVLMQAPAAGRDIEDEAALIQGIGLAAHQALGL